MAFDPFGTRRCLDRGHLYGRVDHLRRRRGHRSTIHLYRICRECLQPDGRRGQSIFWRGGRKGSRGGQSGCSVKVHNLHSRHLLQTQIVSDTILPAWITQFEIRIPLRDPLVYLAELQPSIRTPLDLVSDQLVIREVGFLVANTVVNGRQLALGRARFAR